MFGAYLLSSCPAFGTMCKVAWGSNSFSLLEAFILAVSFLPHKIVTGQQILFNCAVNLLNQDEVVREVMQYMIREMKSQEYRLLSDFLYEAIYIPEGVEAPPRSVIDFPELQEYIIEFGNRKHDKALVAEIQGDIVGAIWVRIMNDLGGASTPSGI